MRPEVEGVAALPGLDLRQLGRDGEPLGEGEAMHRLALRFEAEAAAAHTPIAPKIRSIAKQVRIAPDTCLCNEPSAQRPFTSNMESATLSREDVSMSTTVQKIDPRAAAGSALPRAGTHALVLVSAVLALLIGFSPERADSQDPATLAANCASWDAQASATIPKKLASHSEVGKQVYARSTAVRLAEARRYCANGHDGRAERYYRRIIGW